MSKKIREIIRKLEKSGFINRGGKGLHRNFKHPNGQQVTVSGNLGDDAKKYLERQVDRVIEEVKS